MISLKRKIKKQNKYQDPTADLKKSSATVLCKAKTDISVGIDCKKTLKQVLGVLKKSEWLKIPKRKEEKVLGASGFSGPQSEAQISLRAKKEVGKSQGVI